MTRSQKRIFNQLLIFLIILILLLTIALFSIAYGEEIW